MPKRTAPLTTKIVAASICPPHLKVKKLGDAGSGLTLIVKPAADGYSRTFVHEYAVGGVRKQITIGIYPQTGLIEARQKLAVLKKSIAEGICPIAERKAKEQAVIDQVENSFESVFYRWFEIWRAGKSPRHIEKVLNRAKGEILPDIGSREISKIETKDVMRIVKKMDNRGVSDLAKRALSTMTRVLDYACMEGVAKVNPAACIKPKAVIRRVPVKHQPRVELKEVGVLLRAMWSYDDSGRGKTLTALALQFLPHVFVRASEMVEARWTEIDWSKKQWRIPAARMKMPTEHIVPLTRQSLEILREIKHLSGHTEWLFPSESRAGKTMTTNTLLFAFYRMGFKSRQTTHGWRGIATTALREAGFDRDWVELQMSHAERNAVVAAYNAAQYLKQRTEMMAWWSDWLDEQRVESTNVLPFLPAPPMPPLVNERVA
jgi:integrase